MNLLQTVLFWLFSVTCFVFFCVDVHYFYILGRDSQWNVLFQHPNEYEMIWYLDVFTYLFLYLYLAVKLLCFACKPQKVYGVLKNWFWQSIEVIKPYVTFDTLFKIGVVFVAIVLFKHAMGGSFTVRRLVIISDIRPMANIFYDIYYPLMWFYRFLFF
jgi:hypothetical protein